MQTVPSDRLVPIYKDETVLNFISLDKMDAIPVKIDGMVLFTAPLAFGGEFNILELCEHPRLSHNTDTVVIPAQLETIYLSIDTQLFAFDVTTNPTSTSVITPEGDARTMVFDLRVPSLVVDINTKDINGESLRRLVENPEASIDLQFGVDGLMASQTGDTMMNCTVTLAENDLGVIVMPEGFILNASRYNINMAPIAE